MKLLCTILGFGVSISGFSQAGTLDELFGDGGRVVTNFKGKIITAQAVAIQHDGKIVAAGGRYEYENGFAVSRYLTNGDLDTSFAKNGKKYTDIKGYDRSSCAFAIAIQNDGKILVAGYAEKLFDYNRDFILIRYNTDGTRDSSFGKAGITGADFSQWDEGRSIAIQPDGKIILAGFCTFSNVQIAMSRYEANGLPDHSFGDRGKVITDVVGGGKLATCVGLQADGKIILSGDLGYSAVAMRFQPNGDLDHSFGADGKVKVSGLYFHAMALQTDGKIILGGVTGVSDAVLTRCTMNGILDSSFGKDGYAIRKSKDFQSIHAICLQPDNKILAAGETFTDRTTDDDFLLLRYTTNGLPDSTFGLNGEATPIDFNKLWDRAYAVGLEPDNKIVLAGSATTNYIYGTSPRAQFGIVRFNNDAGIKNKTRTIAPLIVKKNINILPYPNPVQDLLNIQGLDAGVSYELSVMNAKGSVVATAAINNAASYSWNLQSLSKGVYYLRLTSNNKKITVQFVKE